ncbi:F-box SKIP23-like protein (DUF295) [Rhynchospora pubera]|uniref:F-box SKIP23-like protein (DUF295) n=1 Tax=Rhynchospora pubera TaxID=906938 RepID=A0AAV8F1B0_9POAL|nr:F-box SKIP23-like protein (DUF295) [Rhynchospora pubera]
MQVKKALERDWSSLLPEVLNLIAKNLNEICDFVRFRAVCKGWRFSTPVTDLPPQFPWIIEGNINSHHSDSNLKFYSISFDKIYTIQSPKSVGKWFYCQSDGYMLAHPHLKPSQVFLLNLLNNHKITLPAFDFDGWKNWFLPSKNQTGVHAICYVSRSRQLISYHPGQDNWCILKLNSDIATCKLYYLNGMVFSVETQTGVTKVKDITTGNIAFIPPINNLERGYLEIVFSYIVDASGIILRVMKHIQCDPNQVLFVVYQLDMDTTGSGCWVKVDNIGNQALFIDWNACIAVRANDFAGIKRNCIYFLRTFLYGIDRIDIETGARKHFPCPLKGSGRWFVPSLQRLWAK